MELVGPRSLPDWIAAAGVEARDDVRDQRRAGEAGVRGVAQEIVLLPDIVDEEVVAGDGGYGEGQPGSQRGSHLEY